MSFDGINIPQKLVPHNYLELGLAAQRAKQRNLKELLEKRRLPEEGWSDEEIEALVHQFAALDSNNFGHKVGLGEREARIACKLVARRHYNFGHGIGRSGDLLEAQPKAAGSSLLARLTNALILDLIHTLGVTSCTGCFLVPMCTGMTITLCLQTMRKSRRKAKYVLWSRIDQKSCFKAITVAGLDPVIIPCLVENDSLTTDVNAFEKQIETLGVENIVCLYTTTSCFAPRNCDRIVDIAQLAKRKQVPHLVNNAYGLQCSFITRQLEIAHRRGRVDYFVQSSDKNLLVPVGGAIVASSETQRLEQVASSYAGRASGSQTLDVFMTLLSLGRNGFQTLVQKRQEHFKYLKEQLKKFAAAHGEEVLPSEDNLISLAITLRAFGQSVDSSVTQLGAMLHTRGVSGVRVISPSQNKSIDGHTFLDFGSHRPALVVSYLTVAAALGVSRKEIDRFFEILNKCWMQLLKTTTLSTSENLS